MRLGSYVEEAIRNVNKRIKYENMEFSENLSDINYSPKNPFSAVKYKPELDTSDEFTEDLNLFKTLIGVTR